MSTQRRSMTGYGAGTAETADYRVVVEMKAVNQRFLEIAPHMPRAFGAWEGDLRELIRTRVARGKLDVYVSFEDRSEKRYAVHVNEGPITRRSAVWRMPWMHRCRTACA